jgi:serine/threonine protein kinase
MNLDDLNLDDEVLEFLKSQKDFSIDRVSQEGGNCDIFFGHHNIFGLRIALKIYYGNSNSGGHNEPKILSRIDHPNVLRVRDARRIGKNYSYFMTDEIDGGDLEKCHRSGQLDLRDKLNIVHGVLNGISELHKDAISIVHRDIKPKNILIHNSSKVPLISDFGSVKHFDKSLGSVTGSNTTLVYKPAEVFTANKYTRQSDVYQIGVTLFQILDGFFPGAYFDWLNDAQKKKFGQIDNFFEQDIFINKAIERLVVKNDLIRTLTLPDYIDPDIIKIVKKATNPSLTTRYHTTAAFMRDLYSVQKSLTNWKVDSEFLYGTTSKNEQFRISQSSKGFLTERLGAASKWRKTGSVSSVRKNQIEFIRRSP